MNNFTDSSPILSNCVFYENTAFIKGGGVNGSSSTNMACVNCIMWGNTPSQIIGSAQVTYSNIEGGHAGIGNINLAPRFVNRNEGDFHLKSEAGHWDESTQSWVQDPSTSPCIDAGNMASPIMLESFPNGGVINMGAYGGTAEASRSYFGREVCEIIVAGDINGDCRVDLIDIGFIAMNWLDDPRNSGYWLLDGDFTDSFASYDGTAVGDPVFLAEEDAKVGSGAIELDGDDLILVKGYKGITGSAPRTSTAWIKTTDAPGNIMWWGKKDEPGGMWDVRVNGAGKLRVQVDGGGISGNTVINTSEWVHVAAVLPPGGNNTEDVLLYVNGVLETDVAIGSHVLNTAIGANFRIGADNSGNYFSGQLDDVRVYDRALSAEEIEVLANP